MPLISSQKIPKTSRTRSISKDNGLVTPPIVSQLESIPTPESTLNVLYSELVVAKIWGVAKRALGKVGRILMYWHTEESELTSNIPVIASNSVPRIHEARRNEICL